MSAVRFIGLSDRHPVAVELVVFVVPDVPQPEVGETFHEPGHADRYQPQGTEPASTDADGWHPRLLLRYPSGPVVEVDVAVQHRRAPSLVEQ